MTEIKQDFKIERLETYMSFAKNKEKKACRLFFFVIKY